MGEIKDLLKQGASRQKLEAFLDPFQLKANPLVLKNLVSLQKHLAPHCDSEAFLHRVLRAIRETADPEQALNQLERFFLSMDDPASVLPLLAEGRHTLNTLSIIFGASPYLANILIQDPGLLN